MMSDVVNIGLLGEREDTLPAEELEKRGVSYLKRWEYERALACFTQALQLYRRRGQNREAAQQHRHIGDLYMSVQMLEEARHSYQEALDAYELETYVPGIIKTLNNLSRTFIYSDINRALNEGARALAIARSDSASTSQLLVDALLNMGWLYGESSQCKQALESYEQALKLSERYHWPQKKRHILVQIATCYRELGDDKGALEVLTMALALAEQEGDEQSQAQVMSQMGYYYDEKQNDALAYEYYERALIVYQNLENYLGEVAMLEALGYVNLRHQQYEDAMAYYQRALEISQTLKNPFLESETQINLAVIYLSTDRLQEAEACYEQVIELKRTLKDFRGVVECLLEVGRLLNTRHQVSMAEASFVEAVELAKNHGFKHLLAKALFFLAEIKFKNKEEREAVHLFQEASVYSYQTENFHLHLLCSRQIGDIYLQLNEPEEAVRFYEEAIGLAYRAEALDDLLLFYEGLAESYRSLQKREKTFRTLEQGWEIIQKNLNHFSSRQKMDYLKTRANAYFYFEDFREARVLYSESLDLTTDLTNHNEKLELLRLLGLCSGNLNEIDLFAQAYEEALKIARQMNDLNIFISLLKDMGVLYRELGYYSQSLAYCQLIFQRALENHLVAEIFFALDQLVQIYNCLNQSEALIHFFRQAMNYFQQHDHWNESELLLNQLGELYLSAGNKKEAISCFEELLDNLDFTSTEHIQTLLHLGALYEEEQEYESSLRIFETALERAQHFRSQPDEVAALVHLGTLHYDQGNPSKGFQLVQEALGKARVEGDKFYEAWAQCKLGTFYFTDGDLSKAGENLEQALIAFHQLHDPEGIEECLGLLGKIYLQTKKI